MTQKKRLRITKSYVDVRCNSFRHCLVGSTDEIESARKLPPPKRNLLTPFTFAKCRYLIKCMNFTVYSHVPLIFLSRLYQKFSEYLAHLTQLT